MFNRDSWEFGGVDMNSVGEKTHLSRHGGGPAECFLSQWASEFKSERGIGAERLQLESILKRDTLRRRLEGWLANFPPANSEEALCFMFASSPPKFVPASRWTWLASSSDEPRVFGRICRGKECNRKHCGDPPSRPRPSRLLGLIGRDAAWKSGRSHSPLLRIEWEWLCHSSARANRFSGKPPRPSQLSLAKTT